MYDSLVLGHRTNQLCIRTYCSLALFYTIQAQLNFLCTTCLAQFVPIAKLAVLRKSQDRQRR